MDCASGDSPQSEQVSVGTWFILRKGPSRGCGGLGTVRQPHRTHKWGLPRQLRGPERTGRGVAGTAPVGTDVSVLAARRSEVCAVALTRERRDIHGVSRPTSPSLLAVAAASSARWQGKAVALLALLCPVPRPSARTHWFTLPV